MSDDMIRLRGRFGQDEVNHAGQSFRVSPYGTVCVPADAVPPLLKTGGFHIADEDDKGAVYATLEQMLETAWHLPPGKTRSTLLMILKNQNAMNLITQTISFT